MEDLEGRKGDGRRLVVVIVMVAEERGDMKRKGMRTEVIWEERRL